MLEHEEELDDLSIEGCSLSSFGSMGLQKEDDRKWDFSCMTGIKDFLEENPGTKITKGNMNGDYHSHHLNGRFHGMIKATLQMGCQYCFYIWKNDMNIKQQKDFGFMECNQTNTMCCLLQIVGMSAME